MAESVMAPHPEPSVGFPERIAWREISDTDYDRHYAECRRAPLLQSRIYADAICPRLGQTAQRYKLCRGQRTIGIAQLQQARLGFGAVHGVILDRGPVLCAGSENVDAEQVLEAFSQLYPRRFGRRRRVIPEPMISNTAELGDLERLGDRPGYQTIWLDLRNDIPTLRGALRGNWRRDLSKAEAASLVVHVDLFGDDLAWLLDRNDSATRPGPSRAVMIDLARRFLPAGQMMIIRVGPEDAPLAGALFLLHGRSATYQLGWVGAAGRKVLAGHLCLWRGVLALREMGCLDLDLGGVNDADARGVKKFKQGLGGELVTLSGQYR